MELKSLIRKYSVPGPRYTSYPTAPQWTDEVSTDAYAKKLLTTPPNDDLALYVHIPYCEKLCFYCGCNMLIRQKDDGVMQKYVTALKNEIDLVSKKLGNKRTVQQVSLGGGTPTYLSSKLLVELFTHIKNSFSLDPSAEVSIEVDPRVTSEEQLTALRTIGFNRVSLGVQDFSEKVQKAVNRIQPADATHQMLNTCRTLGYRGINFDLMYGLPYQTIESFQKTVNQVIQMAPDRIALYNYAHLPTMIKHQEILDKLPRPSANERIDIFTLAFNSLKAAGYKAIGMDHFAKKDDEMYQALNNNSLYRNFMGYTVKRAGHMVGLGMSAIGEINGAFFQNIKPTGAYLKQIDHQSLATQRGFIMSEDDLQRKWIIQNLMCGLTLSFKEFSHKFGVDFEKTYGSELVALEPFFVDGILERKSQSIEVTELGRLFIRNAAMVFDAYLSPENSRYSKTV